MNKKQPVRNKKEVALSALLSSIIGSTILNPFLVAKLKM